LKPRFVDLLLPGWIDRAGPVPVCHPLAFDACLQAESGLIQFTSVNSRGGLHIDQIDQIEYDEDLRNDPDEEIAAASVGVHYLNVSGPVRCTGSMASGSAPATPQTSGCPRPAHPGTKNSSARSRKPPGGQPGRARTPPCSAGFQPAAPGLPRKPPSTTPGINSLSPASVTSEQNRT
jgi:hypothetical protein